MADEEPIPYQHRYVCDARTSSMLAKGHVRWLHQRRGIWIFYGLFFLYLAAINIVFDDDGTPPAAAFIACLLGTSVVAAFLSGLVFFKNRRTSRPRIYDGAVLESGFGDDALVTRNPSSSSRIAYQAIKSIDISGPTVCLRFDGSPIVHIYPRELFPDAEVARLKQHAGSRR